MDGWKKERSNMTKVKQLVNCKAIFKPISSRVLDAYIFLSATLYRLEDGGLSDSGLMCFGVLDTGSASSSCAVCVFVYGKGLVRKSY